MSDPSSSSSSSSSDRLSFILEESRDDIEMLKYVWMIKSKDDIKILKYVWMMKPT